ncbi:MAG: hypothetical protein IPM64_07725 [Phycisphaerales bacterium]|nr:hypothetical protein [Phycisphaerales bacterium]
MAEFDAHGDEHGRGQDASNVAHVHQDAHHPHHPHHQHDPNGDPVSHGEHSCLCTGGTPPGAALQVPALEPAAIIADDDVSLANLDTTFLLVLLKARGPTDASSDLRCAPLLI